MSLKIYTILCKDKVRITKIKNSECLKLQSISSLLTTKISTLVLG